MRLMKRLKCVLLLAVVIRFSVGCLAGSVTVQGDVASCLSMPGRHDFVFEGREAIVVTPDSVADGSPWIWRPAFFGAFDAVDKALLQEGFHVVYYDLTHGYGSPSALLAGDKFYRFAVDSLGLSPKTTLEGFSRGGFFVLQWAARNPSAVACIYVDAPVCNLLSWPGRQRADLWNDALRLWGIDDADAEGERLAAFRPDLLQRLAAARIPVMAVCGDSDTEVPYDENMKVWRDRYSDLGAPVELILKPGVGHHPHSLENPEPVVDFILRHQPGEKEKHYIRYRGSLSNSFHKMQYRRKARVAFLGGSITEMEGWHNLVMQQLRQRFPYTEFDFVCAGIPSTGTTPGAFRIENDVLSRGEIDLLFVEAAVNDDTNHFDYIEQVRGMEGEVRHAREACPEVDIIMLHFIYDPFIEDYAEGRIPDVILNHERVANHYAISSIDLAHEIADRMAAGEFTWEEFGGTHPHMMGHKYYAAAIASLFDEMWSSAPGDTLKAHALPADKLDDYSYCNGRFVDIRRAEYRNGWSYIEAWQPDSAVQTRPGFVDVPMLVADKPGKVLTFDFTGTAVGIFCVAGPHAATLEYSVDGAPYKRMDTYTEWSSWLYLPWVYMFETELENKPHRLRLRVAKGNAGRTECIIRNFVVNTMEK